jgi:ribosome-binding factor A
MQTIRQKRTADQIQMLLSELLLRDLKDPRVQGVTIMDVRVDRELQYADVYVHALGEEEREEEVLEGLKSASGFVRHRVAQALNTRSVPQMHFHWDPSVAHADRMHQLLDELVVPDEEE